MIKKIKETKEKELMKLVLKVAPRILDELGILEIAKEDGILSRISFGKTEDHEIALFSCELNTYRKLFSFDETYEYIPHSGRIVFDIRYLLLEIPFRRESLKKIVISTLSHELRHYYQYISGEMFTNSKVYTDRFHRFTRTGSMLEYKNSWEEVDANSFQRKMEAKYKQLVS